MAETNNERTTVSLSQITSQSREGNTFPLSFNQQQMWLLDQLTENLAVFNVPYALRLLGQIDQRVLSKSILEIVSRHEILRTTFTVVDGQPVQVIAPHATISIPVIDINKFEDGGHAFRVAVESSHPLPIIDPAQETSSFFDLSKGPLLQATLFRLADNDHVLLLRTHLIISDGWSMEILFRELTILYDAFSKALPSPLSELPIQYADFALWQREQVQGEVLSQLLSYWQEQLSGSLPLLDLPTDRPRLAVRTFEGRSQSMTLPDSLTQALKAFSQQEDVSLFMTLLAAFKILLHRYTGQEDMIVGAPIANRERDELEGMMGFLSNTLVLRTDLSGNPSFRAFLSRSQEVVEGAFAHQELPFDKLIEEVNPSRELNQQPLFQVELTFQERPVSLMEHSGLKWIVLPVEKQIEEYDLSLKIIDNGKQLITTFEYCPDLFNQSTISRMMGHFERLLEGIVANPEQPIHKLPLLTEAERHKLLVEFNSHKIDYPKDVCIHEVIESQVEQTPDAIAVVYGLAGDNKNQRLTYRELSERSNQLAHHLLHLGVKPEDLVCICVERGLDMVTGTLGILKAGGAYVPLDPTYPKSRLAVMLKDAQPSVIVTQSKLLDILPEHDAQVVCLDSDWHMIAKQSTKMPSSEVSANNLAYCIYTSGSTGQPKGAMITHRSLVNAYYAWEEDYPLRFGTSSHLQTASISFDIFTGDIVRALCFGAKMVICPQDWQLDPEKLYRLMVHEKVDYAEFMPAVLRNLLKYLKHTNQSLDFMRMLLVSSDIWYMHEYKALFDYCGEQTQVINSYGLTEMTIDSTFFESRRDEDRFSDNELVSIGRPFANTSVYILDRFLQPVPIGVLGELYIGGEGVARGFINRPALTAQRFPRDPFSSEPGARMYKTGDLGRFHPDGMIELRGRVDNQVKIRGYRIELGEIEAVLQEHESVRQGVVMAREDVPGHKYLVAYIVPHENASPPVSELREFLKGRLPEYMVPAAFMTLNELPLTSNRKVNRRAFPVPERVGSENNYVAPRNNIEQTMADIWQNLLALERVGIHDNFFEVGGHSLLAFHLVLKLSDTLKIKFPLRHLFEYPTIAELAQVIEEIRGSEEADSKD